MPNDTPRGLPYPLPTELVRDGARRIRELAEEIDPGLAQWVMTANQWNDQPVEVRSTPWEPTMTFNLPRFANTVLITATWQLALAGLLGGGQTGFSAFDAYLRWDGVELFRYVLTPHADEHGPMRTYSFQAAALNQAAGDHTAQMGMFSGMGLIMHPKMLACSIHALGGAA